MGGSHIDPQLDTNTRTNPNPNHNPTLTPIGLLGAYSLSGRRDLLQQDSRVRVRIMSKAKARARVRVRVRPQ